MGNSTSLMLQITARCRVNMYKDRKLLKSSSLTSYDNETGVFTVPPGGDGVYYFSTFVVVQDGELARFDMRLNNDIICSTVPDHDEGAPDLAPGSCSAIVDVMAGK